MDDQVIYSVDRGHVVVSVGDITIEQVDVVVNAANSTLRGGGGVDGAIHKKGGPSILRECEKIRRDRYPGGLPTGLAVMTSGGELPAKFVIHTVGPVRGNHGGQDAVLLANCYRNSLILAAQHGLASIAFPAISTGVYGYPKEEAAAVSSQTIKDVLVHDSVITLIRLIFYSSTDAEIYIKHHRF
ncbi:MAG TPA: O-acetyl-ADP-ribose deacetylase [Nitrospirales bacterium]|jgi:O-acetyl-ADP-ribose deacetylase (regulator of RNase III)